MTPPWKTTNQKTMPKNPKTPDDNQYCDTFNEEDLVEVQIIEGTEEKEKKTTTLLAMIKR